MKRSFLLFLFFCSLSWVVSTGAQEPGYRIEVSIDDYDGEQVYLGYRYADKIFSKDTIERYGDKFILEGETPLAPGLYLVLMPPENKYFEFVVTEKNQRFSVSTKAPDYFDNLKFKGSEENRLLNDYQVFMGEQVERSKQIQGLIESETDEKKKEKLQRQLQDITEGVRAYQDKTVADHPDSFTSKLIQAFQEPVIPDPPVREDGSIDSTFRFTYYKAHYWDGFDFSYEAFVNTPYLKQKIDRYIDKLTLQVPDSVVAAVDLVVEKSEINHEVFKYCLPYLMNKYFKPEIMGLDAVFVHLSDKYYKTGKADWVPEDNLKKITDDAFMMKGVLLGNPAPDVKVQRFDPQQNTFTNQLISPYDIDAEFLVIFLWKPGCGYCAKMTQELIPFYEEWKDQGVEIFSITSANQAELDKAIEDIAEKKMPWIITADPYLRARAMQNYYGTSLPKLFLLDKHKKVIANRIGVPQLPEIIKEYRQKEGAG